MNIKKGFLKNLMKIYNEKKLGINEYSYFSSLAYLLKHQELAELFIEKD